MVVDARTDITTKLLSEQGYTVMAPVGEDGLQEHIFVFKDFEKKFFSKATNELFCQTFIKNGLRDPVTGEFGKGLVFAVSQNHAARLTPTLQYKLLPAYPMPSSTPSISPTTICWGRLTSMPCTKLARRECV